MEAETLGLLLFGTRCMYWKGALSQPSVRFHCVAPILMQGLSFWPWRCVTVYCHSFSA